MELGWRLSAFAPNALQRFALPQALGQGRTVVRRMGLGTDQSDGAGRVHIADTVDGGIRRHAAAHDQVGVIWHSFLLVQSSGYESNRLGKLSRCGDGAHHIALSILDDRESETDI